jgi:hypothetical protein
MTSEIKAAADLIEQIDMSHDEIVRKARNEALEEAAKLCEMIGEKKSKDGIGFIWDNKDGHYFCATNLDCARLIRSRIVEKGVGE